MNELLRGTEFTIKLNPEGLTEQHKRLIRYLNIYILKSLSAKEESEYYQCTEDAFKMLTAIVKQSNFNNPGAEVPHSEQALEMSLDSIRDLIYTKETDIYDN